MRLFLRPCQAIGATHRDPRRLGFDTTCLPLVCRWFASLPCRFSDTGVRPGINPTESPIKEAPVLDGRCPCDQAIRAAVRGTHGSSPPNPLWPSGRKVAAETEPVPEFPAMSEDLAETPKPARTNPGHPMRINQKSNTCPPGDRAAVICRATAPAAHGLCRARPAPQASHSDTESVQQVQAERTHDVDRRPLVRTTSKVAICILPTRQRLRADGRKRRGAGPRKGRNVEIHDDEIMTSLRRIAATFRGTFRFRRNVACHRPKRMC